MWWGSSYQPLGWMSFIGTKHACGSQCQGGRITFGSDQLKARILAIHERRRSLISLSVAWDMVLLHLYDKAYQCRLCMWVVAGRRTKSVWHIPYCEYCVSRYKLTDSSC